MAPIVDGLEAKYRGDLQIMRVNTDRTNGKKLARELGLVGQPTFVFFNASGQEMRRLMGAQTEETLERELFRLLEK